MKLEYDSQSFTPHSRDYGSLARIGIATPQANPTVEPEMSVLFPAGVSQMASRLVSSGDPRQRFMDYFLQLESTLKSYDTLQLDVFGFACTASSYLIDKKQEKSTIDALEDQFSCPVVTAAAAIGEALHFLGAEQIAIACPYPQWLLDLAFDYWQNAGFRIGAKTSVQPQTADTRSIYELRGAEACDIVAKMFAKAEADVFLITGTGMPGLQAIIDLQELTGKTVLTSNLCLAWSCLRRAGVPLNERTPDQKFPLLSGWQSEISRL